MTWTTNKEAILIICILLGIALPCVSGISWTTLIFLRQRAQALQQQSSSNSGIRPSWGEWGQWTVCTDTIETGVRVRSRPCNTISCDKLPGNNYEVEMCNRKLTETRTQREKFLKMCNDDKDLRGTLSCRLYREDPTKAYDIYQSTGCLFNVIGDQEVGEEGQTEVVFGRPPITSEGEVGLAFQPDLNTAPVSSGRFSETGITTNPASTPRSLASNVVNVLATNQYCTNACESIVVRASRVASNGPSAPTTLAALLQLVKVNPYFRDNSQALSREYSSCLANCRILGPSYGALRTSLINSGRDSALRNPALSVIFGNINEGVGRRRRRRETSGKQNITAKIQSRPLILGPNRTEELLLTILNSRRHRVSNKQEKDDRIKYAPLLTSKSSPAQKRKNVKFILAQLEAEPTVSNASGNATDDGNTTSKNFSNHYSARRLRRQASATFDDDDYRSPCFVRASLSSDPRVLDLDGQQGELFFFEGNQQKFVRRRCMGQSLPGGTLFRPREPVTQQRTNRNAVCKQGYLQRYGLLIQLDPKGNFAFNDGQKFSIKFRPFRLESHCGLAVLA